MKASDLVKMLQDLIDEHGDLPVAVDNPEWGPDYDVSNASYFHKNIMIWV